MATARAARVLELARGFPYISSTFTPDARNRDIAGIIGESELVAKRPTPIQLDQPEHICSCPAA